MENTKEGDYVKVKVMHVIRDYADCDTMVYITRKGKLIDKGNATDFFTESCYKDVLNKKIRNVFYENNELVIEI